MTISVFHFAPGFTGVQQSLLKLNSSLETVAKLQSFVVSLTLSRQYFYNDSMCGLFLTDQKVCHDMWRSPFTTLALFFSLSLFLCLCVCVCLGSVSTVNSPNWCLWPSVICFLWQRELWGPPTPTPLSQVPTFL